MFRTPLTIAAILAGLLAQSAKAQSGAEITVIGTGTRVAVTDIAQGAWTEVHVEGDGANLDILNRAEDATTRVTLYGGMTVRVVNDGATYDGVGIPCRPGRMRPDVHVPAGAGGFDAIGCD